MARTKGARKNLAAKKAKRIWLVIRKSMKTQKTPRENGMAIAAVGE
jgi:hypothetical protein